MADVPLEGSATFTTVSGDMEVIYRLNRSTAC
jgi:hypothetical protein